MISKITSHIAEYKAVMNYQIKLFCSIIFFLLAAFLTEVSAQSFAPIIEKAACPRIPKTDADETACQELIQKYPNDPDLYFNLGNFFASIKNDRESARKWFTRGITEGPNYPRTLIVSALLAQWDGQLEKAIDNLNEAIKFNPMDVMAYINRATIFQSKGDYEKAITDYNEAIRMDPKFSKAYLNRAEVWLKKGENEKAIVDLNETIKLEPNNSNAFNDRGVAWYRKGKLDKALLDYNEAIRLNQTNPHPYANRANMLNLRGKYDKAIIEASESIKLDPTIGIAYYIRGNSQNMKGNYDKALTDYNEAIKLDNSNYEAFNNRGYVWNIKGEYEYAIADFNEAIKLNPKFTYAYLNRGIAWNKKVEYDKAILDFKEALRIDPKLRNASENLEFVLAKKAKIEKRLAQEEQPNASAKLLFEKKPIGKRVALVIGNGKYKMVDALDNPLRDAELLATSLRNSDFELVTLKFDLSREKMISALKDFENETTNADVAVLYFAGHGIEVGGNNYMIPIDAEIVEEQNISATSVNMEYLLNAVEGAKKMRLVILDACRNNPFVDKVRSASITRSVGRIATSSLVGKALGRVEPQPGTLVIYAAKHGEYALDGEGKNSPFVDALVKRIEQKPPLEVRRLFDFVRQDVFNSTNKEQQPFAYGSLEATEDFYFTK